MLKVKKMKLIVKKVMFKGEVNSRKGDVNDDSKRFYRVSNQLPSCKN